MPIKTSRGPELKRESSDLEWQIRIRRDPSQARRVLAPKNRKCVGLKIMVFINM